VRRNKSFRHDRQGKSWVSLRSACPGDGLIVLLERLQVRHQIHKIPEATIATAGGDVARVTGVVRAITPLLTSLLAGRPCVAYRTRLASRGGRGRGRQRRPVDQSESVAVIRFAIDRAVDDYAIVEGSHALFDASDLDLPRDNGAREEHVRLLFGQTGSVTTRREVTIEVGATVTVVGRAMFDMQADRGEHGFRDAPTPQLRLVGDYANPLSISQHD
jgi:hypothetical protein